MTFFRIKTLEHPNVSQACAGCQDRHMVLSELRAINDRSNRKLLLLCDDCLHQISRQINQALKEPV